MNIYERADLRLLPVVESPWLTLSVPAEVFGAKRCCGVLLTDWCDCWEFLHVSWLECP